MDARYDPRHQRAADPRIEALLRQFAAEQEISEPVKQVPFGFNPRAVTAQVQVAR